MLSLSAIVSLEEGTGLERKKPILSLEKAIASVAMNVDVQLTTLFSSDTMIAWLKEINLSLTLMRLSRDGITALIDHFQIGSVQKSKLPFA